MRPWLVLAACGALCGVVVLAARQISTNPDNPNYVPHPADAMLAVTFAHADHTDTNCSTCHHNFTDDTGQGLCYDCHKSDAELSPLMEKQFHDLCRQCHVEQLLAGEPHGPTRACAACHQPDQAP